MKNLRHSCPLSFSCLREESQSKGRVGHWAFHRELARARLPNQPYAGQVLLVSDVGRFIFVNASVRMNAYPCENANRAACLVSAQRAYIPTAVPSGKLGRYKQARTITNTRAHERLRNKPSPPIMARVEIKTR